MKPNTSGTQTPSFKQMVGTIENDARGSEASDSAINEILRDDDWIDNDENQDPISCPHKGFSQPRSTKKRSKGKRSKAPRRRNKKKKKKNQRTKHRILKAPPGNFLSILTPTPTPLNNFGKKHQEQLLGQKRKQVGNDLAQFMAKTYKLRKKWIKKTKRGRKSTKFSLGPPRVIRQSKWDELQNKRIDLRNCQNKIIAHNGESTIKRGDVYTNRNGISRIMKTSKEIDSANRCITNKLETMEKAIQDLITKMQNSGHKAMNWVFTWNDPALKLQDKRVVKKLASKILKNKNSVDLSKIFYSRAGYTEPFDSVNPMCDAGFVLAQRLKSHAHYFVVGIEHFDVGAHLWHMRKLQSDNGAFWTQEIVEKLISYMRRTKTQKLTDISDLQPLWDESQWKLWKEGKPVGNDSIEINFVNAKIIEDNFVHEIQHTPHFQGYIQLSRQCNWIKLKEELFTAGQWFSIAKGSTCQNQNYCKKENNWQHQFKIFLYCRVEHGTPSYNGQNPMYIHIRDGLNNRTIWNGVDAFQKFPGSLRSRRQIKVMGKLIRDKQVAEKNQRDTATRQLKGFYPWLGNQLLKESHPRWVYWIWGPKYLGKSEFASALYHNLGRTVLPFPTQGSNEQTTAAAWFDYDNQRIGILDYTSNESDNNFNYGLLEDAKARYFTSTKYESHHRSKPVMQIVVFANVPPQFFRISKKQQKPIPTLSTDRWKVFEIRKHIPTGVAWLWKSPIPQSYAEAQQMYPQYTHMGWGSCAPQKQESGGIYVGEEYGMLEKAAREANIETKIELAAMLLDELPANELATQTQKLGSLAEIRGHCKSLLNHGRNRSEDGVHNRDESEQDCAIFLFQQLQDEREYNKYAPLYESYWAFHADEEFIRDRREREQLKQDRFYKVHRNQLKLKDEIDQMMTSTWDGVFKYAEKQNRINEIETYLEEKKKIEEVELKKQSVKDKKIEQEVHGLAETQNRVCQYMQLMDKCHQENQEKMKKDGYTTIPLLIRRSMQNKNS